MRFSPEQFRFLRDFAQKQIDEVKTDVIDAEFPDVFSDEELSNIRTLLENQTAILNVVEDNEALINDDGQYKGLTLEECNQVRELIAALKSDNPATVKTNPANEKPE